MAPRAKGEKMIIGIGSDLIDIRRIEKSLERYGERFIAAHLHRRRAERSEGRREPRRLLCQALRRQGGLFQGARHAASREGVFWRDMGVVNLPGGKPTMELTGGAAQAAGGDDCPQATGRSIHLTITDDFPLAQAFVIIEALPVEERATI